MAYVDAYALFSNDQAITADADSTDHMNLVVARDLGPGETLWCIFTVTAAFNNLTSLNMSVQVDDNSGFSSPTTIASTGEILLAVIWTNDNARRKFDMFPEFTTSDVTMGTNSVEL